MTQNDARNFVMALNTLAPYVPPMMFQPLMSNPVCRVLEAIANGQMEPEALTVAPAKPNGKAEADAQH